ncbi:MAG: hypothetical protein CO034_02680, partial [Parcubacteria group bacterium CG_4_9_14_0_2_um_filter_35_11]
LKDDKLKSIFSVLILSILGSTPDKISATVGILSLREFIFDGGYYPLNGMQGFAGTLLKKYLEYKGDIKLSSSVDHIMIQNGRAIGVSFSGNNVE